MTEFDDSWDSCYKRYVGPCTDGDDEEDNQKSKQYEQIYIIRHN